MSALLNPSSLVVSRIAGIAAERTRSGAFARRPAADAPLIYTGGGRTELHLELMFDGQLHGALNGNASGGTRASEPDVRDLTAPFFALAENAIEPTAMPIVRFVWGKAWNVRGVVAAVSERLEHFTQSGVPQRSWMTMRFLRMLDGSPSGDRKVPASAIDTSAASAQNARDVVVPDAATASDVLPGERLDRLAARYYGDPSLWRVLAKFNNIDDPSNLAPGTILRIPPMRTGEAS